MAKRTQPLVLDKIVLPDYEYVDLPEPLRVVEKGNNKTEGIAIAANQKGMVRVNFPDRQADVPIVRLICWNGLQVGDPVCCNNKLGTIEAIDLSGVTVIVEPNLMITERFSFDQVTKVGELNGIATEIEKINADLIETERTFLNSGKAALGLYKLLGEKLTIARADPEIGGYGKWLPWLEARGIDQNRAKRAIRICKNWPQLETIAQSQSVSVTDLTLTEALGHLVQKPSGELETPPTQPIEQPQLSPSSKPSPEGRTFEEVVELFAPWGTFARNSIKKTFKYVFERPGSVHFFRGLDEAARWHSEHCIEANKLCNLEPTPQTDSLGVSPFAPSTLSFEPDRVVDAAETEPELVINARSVHARSVMTSALTCEHGTPPEILEAVYACLGDLDLDPCSNDHDSPNVQADYHFTQEDDGLSQEWGTVDTPSVIFMNPPYSMPRIDSNGSIVLNTKGQPLMESVMHLWIDKLLTEFNAGRVESAIVLVKGDTSAQWHRKLRDFVRCEYAGRVQFVGNENPATFCTHLFYIGHEIGLFWRCFAELGDIWQRIEPDLFGE